MERLKHITLGAVFLSLVGGFFLSASAERFTGGSYTIDASVIGNSFGGDTSGGSYKLTSSGGESIIGQGAGGSYKLGSGYVAQLENSLELAVQPGNLVAYYGLDEPSGTFTRDGSVNGFNGTTVGTASVAGKVGQAYDFDGGSGTIVTVPDNNTLDQTADFTVSAWIKPGISTQGTLARIVAKTGNYFLAYDAAGTKMQFIVYCSAQTTATSTTNLTNTANWYHLAGTRVGNTMTLYVNGVSEHQATCSAGGVATTNPFELGNSSGTPQPYDGLIDEVKLYSRGLSANEIKAEYDAGTAGNESGLSFATSIIAGTSQTSNFDVAVLSDAKGYSLSASQNQNLTKGGDSIPGVSGSIASPVSWSEGSTKGLGFTLFGTNATSIDGKWGSGGSYAAFPGSATTFYTRVGQGTKDVVNMRLRLDVNSTQTNGLYTNVLTTTGTITP